MDSEQVLVDDTTFSEISRDQIRSHIYAQEKEPAILSGTISTLFKVKNSGRISMEQAIEAASAADILDSLEGDGFNAEVVERGRTLSGGQRQRLALARTIFVDAPIVVLDDPTSAVDAHTEARIASRLKQIRGTQTTVVFTTSPLLLDHTDQVFMITEGRVAAVGNHFELLKKNEIYKELVVRGE